MPALIHVPAAGNWVIEMNRESIKGTVDPHLTAGSSYTVEDMEQYIEYARKLYDMVNNAFSPPQMKIEKGETDPMDKYMEAVQVIATMNGDTAQKIFFSLLKNFDDWMWSDCPFTGHKGKPVTIKMSAP